MYWGIPPERDARKKGHAIVAYDLRYREGSSGDWTTVEDVWTEGSGILKHEIVSLNNNQAYELQVRAQDLVSHNDCSALSVFDNGNISATRCALALPTWSSAVTATPSDYDEDDDGLIEVRNLAQLNAMRYDRDGDGVVTDDAATTGTNEFTEYTNAFYYPALGHGCPDSGCNGYERNLRATPGNQRIDLSWDAPHDVGIPALSHYQVLYRVVGISVWTTGPLVTSPATSAAITGLTVEGPYQVLVGARNTYGGSHHLTYPAVPLTVGLVREPGLPPWLGLLPRNGGIDVAWYAPADRGLPPLHAYSVQYRKRTDRVGVWQELNIDHTEDAKEFANRRTLITGLTNG